MALIDRAKKPPQAPRRRGPECSVGSLLTSLPKGEAKALRDMLYATWPGTKNWRWSKDDLYDAVTDEGYQVGRTSINHHRSGNCGCPKVES